MLMGILAGIAVPALGRLFHSVAADADARSIMAVFHSARTSALTLRKEVTVAISPADERLTTVIADDNGVASASGKPLTLQDSKIEKIYINGKEMPLHKAVEVTIYPAMVKQQVELILGGADGRKSSVILHPGGGRVVIQ